MFKFLRIFAIFLIFTLKLRDILGNEKIFISNQNNTYYIETEQKFTWYNALARCASINMSLVTIDSKAKLDDITVLVNTPFSQGHLWLGGCVNAIDPLEYVWVATGKKFEFNNWASDQPDFNNSTEYCAHMRASTMLWNDIVCTYQMGFMCEYKQQMHKCKEEESKVVSHSDTFGNENIYVSEQDKTYYIESEQQYTWYSALVSCASMNMSLVTIDSKAKSDDIKALLNNVFDNKLHLWIGGCLKYVNPRQFFWISTGKKFAFTNWDSSQPNFLDNNDYCVHMESKANDSWFDSKCASSKGFMCEYNQMLLQKCEEETKVVKLPCNECPERSRQQNMPDGHSILRDIIFNIKP